MVPSMPSPSRPPAVAATARQTLEALVDRSNRSAIPIRKTFMQQKEGTKSVPGPFAPFVTSNDKFGLRLYLLLLTVASTSPWDVAMHSAVWARALGVENPQSDTARSRVSKAWTRLEKRGLIEKGRKNRVASVTLLTEDGTGVDYSRPVADFISIPHDFWLDGPDDDRQWHEVLTLAEIAVLMIAHMNLDKFALPAERAPDYHGISADTFTRGAKKLEGHGLLEIEWSHKTAPTTPAGWTWEQRYTMQPPFGPIGKLSRTVGTTK